MRLQVTAAFLFLWQHQQRSLSHAFVTPLTRYIGGQTLHHNHYRCTPALFSTLSSVQEVVEVEMTNSAPAVSRQAEEAGDAQNGSNDGGGGDEILMDVSVLVKGRTLKGMWRPDKQDVERISWGKPAKKKGVGSRGVPHRLNQEERQLFDAASRSKGFLEVTGSAWRSQRRDAPLLNTYRSWCDACAQASIVVHKSSNGVEDAVVVDISPLRLETAAQFEAVAKACQKQQSGGILKSQGSSSGTENENDNDTDSNDNDNQLLEGGNENDILHAALFESDAWETRPIYQLSPYYIVWDSLQRSEAKQLAKTMAKFFQISVSNNDKGGPKMVSSKKPVGVKHGKGRRHGGYGIG